MSKACKPGELYRLKLDDTVIPLDIIISNKIIKHSVFNKLTSTYLGNVCPLDESYVSNQGINPISDIFVIK